MSERVDFIRERVADDPYSDLAFLLDTLEAAEAERDEARHNRDSMHIGCVYRYERAESLVGLLGETLEATPARSCGQGAEFDWEDRRSAALAAFHQYRDQETQR